MSSVGTILAVPECYVRGRQAAIFLHANLKKSNFQKYSQNLQNVNLEQSYGEEIMTNDVWGALEMF